MKKEAKRILTKPNCKCFSQDIFLNLNFPLNIKDLQYFLKLEYKSKASYTNRGIFYIEGQSIIAIGAIGSNKLKIKCKNTNCFNELDSLEALIKEM